ADEWFLRRCCHAERRVENQLVHYWRQASHRALHVGWADCIDLRIHPSDVCMIEQVKGIAGEGELPPFPDVERLLKPKIHYSRAWLLERIREEKRRTVCTACPENPRGGATGRIALNEGRVWRPRRDGNERRNRET